MTFTGVIERITFQASDSGFTIFKVAPAAGGELITCVGNLAETGNILGLSYELDGEWTVDPRYGKQLKLVSARCVRPTTKDGLKRYIAYAIDGLGEHTAGALVDALGDRTVAVLDAGDPQTLLAIPGIGKQRAETIMEQWSAGQSNRETLVNLMSLGISQSLCVKIMLHYDALGADAWDVVQGNPYSLTEMWGVGFKTADKIARHIGFALDDQRRVKAALSFVLQQARDGEGHCFLPQCEVVSRLVEVTSLEAQFLGDMLEDFESERNKPESARRLHWEDAFVLDYDGTDEFDGPRYYLPGMYWDERKVADCLKQLVENPVRGRNWLPTAALSARFQEEVGYPLTDEQMAAVQGLRAATVGVLTGSPGVGKTACLRAIIIQAEAAGLSVALAAPTGRAAKRMEEMTHHDASTIHRLLRWTDTGFIHNGENPLQADLVVIDESSMVDIRLMRSLVEALDPGRTQLLLVGDKDQLPSVGAGNVLRDVIQSGAVTVFHLTQIMRQCEGSGIIVDAHRINRGELPTLDWGDCTLAEADEPERVQEIIKSLCANATEETQVLSPQKTGDLGTRALNKMLQQTLNPPGSGRAEIKVGGGERERVFRVGDRVMVCRNNYTLGRMNGDLATISQIHQKDREITLDFGSDGNSVYASSDFADLDHAWAISIHKSQGNEFAHVVIVCHNSMSYMLSRPIGYTAISRAQKRVVVVGQQAAVQRMVRNNKVVVRHTRLKELL